MSSINSGIHRCTHIANAYIHNEGMKYTTVARIVLCSGGLRIPHHMNGGGAGKCEVSLNVAYSSMSYSIPK